MVPGASGDPSASGMTGTNAGCLADREKNCDGEIWRALAALLSVSSQLGHCRDAIMVQCWVWLVGIVWQPIWKTTWQMEWKVGNTLRCRMVLPDVWHESVELECGWSCVRVAGF